MTLGPEIVVLVDFDGTLLPRNSFHLWLRFILLGKLRTIPVTARFFCKLKVLLFVFLRIVRIIDHAGLKCRIQESWDVAVRRSPEQGVEIGQFVDLLVARINPGLLVEVRTFQDAGAKLILTTAAVAEYAVPVGRRLGFDDVVATPAFGHGPWFHNMGVAKMETTLGVLEDRHWQAARRIFYTDHADDKPLMEHVDEVHLVAGDQQSAERLSKVVPGGKRVVVFRYEGGLRT